MTKNSKLFQAVVFCSLSLPALAQVAEAPRVNEGDSWTVHAINENQKTGWSERRFELKVARVTPSHIYLETKQVGSTQPAAEMILGTDWSRARNVNGVETIVSKPLVFPLSVGKSWSNDFTEQNPNKNEKSLRWLSNYKVTAYETLETPAGKFGAYKIEAEGSWTSVREAQQSVVQGVQTGGGNTTMVTQSTKTVPQTVTGNTYGAYWYSPDLKRVIKMVEETYAPDGKRSAKLTEELEAYTLPHQAP
jgi:VCBS repeat-containing protein